MEERKEQENTPPSAKKVRGRPITKANAKQYQLSAARAKKQRKQARMEMLNAMVTQLNLGDELVKAVKSQDDKALSCIEKALRITGLHFDQGPEAVQNVKVDAKSETKSTSTQMVKFVLDAPPAPQG